MSEERMPGVPDPEGEYFASIQFGRKAKAGEPGDKVYLDLTYPNLPYGSMVAIQKLLSEEALPALVEMGEMTAELMGQPVMSLEDTRAYLKAVKAERGKK